MGVPLLILTDGTDIVNLLGDNSGFHIRRWWPAIPGEKGGGIWQSSLFSDGRVPITDGPYENAIETFELVANAGSQDAVIRDTQNLRRLAKKAKNYYASRRTTAPVWIEARGRKETNTRYAVIRGWTTGPDGDPFSTPFDSPDCTAAMGEFTLILERDHWRNVPPLTSNCVPIERPVNYDLGTTDYYGGTDSDDADMDTLSGAVVISGTTIRVGENYAGGGVPVEVFDGGLVFDSIIRPSGAYQYLVVQKAELKIYADGNGGAVANPNGIDIRGFDEDDTATFSTTENFSNRPTTAATEDITDANITDGVLYTIDVTSIVTEIVKRTGWESGNSVGFIFTSAGLDQVFRFATRENVTYDPPKLTITWYGDEITRACSYVFMGNNETSGLLAYYYFYDASLTTYSANLLRPLGFPVNLFPVAPATGDILYFGAPVANFSSLIFNLDTGAGVGITAIDWEYWNGAAWADLNPSEVDNTEFFTVDGECNISWIPSTTWDASTINGRVAFWVRGTLTVAGHALMPQQIQRPIYTMSTASIRIPKESVGGDIPALLQSESVYIGQANLNLSGMLAGLRSDSRNPGNSFRAYINLGNSQNPSGVSVSIAYGEDVTLTLASGYPTGKVALYNPNDTDFEERLRVFLTDDYIGRYRAFIRVYDTSGAANETSVRLNVSGVYTQKVYIPNISSTNTELCLLDFGVVEYTGRVRDLNNYAYSIIIEAGTTDGASPGDMYFVDLILMPCDEWIGNFLLTPTNITYAMGIKKYEEILFDSAETVRNDIEGSISEPALGTSAGLQIRSSGPAILQENLDQQIYFLFYYNSVSSDGSVFSNPFYPTRVYLKSVQRYLSMRGDR